MHPTRRLVVSVEPCGYPDQVFRVFDISVRNTRLYVANGCVVSNSKRVAMMDVNALLSHGAMANLRDMSIRGQRSEDWWLQFMQGHTPRDPKVPLVYDKFINQLKAAGIDIVRDGNQQHFMALTDSSINKLAGDRVLKNGHTVNFDHELKPVPGGLFDPQLTGGHGGRQWSRIPLREPMPNPVMEEPIRRVLGLTQKKFEGVLAGSEEFERHGSGPQAIVKALEDFNVERELAVARAQFHSGKRTLMDPAAWKIGVLKSAQKQGIHPKEWVLNNAPVLPPLFRPVSIMGATGVPLVADANMLYKELHEANENLGHMKREVGDTNVGPERLALYHAFKAVTGLGDPITVKSQEKNIKGVLASVFGSSPKYGCFDDATEILTARGWVPLAQLIGQIEVATLNPVTGAFVWLETTEIFHYDYAGRTFPRTDSQRS